MSSGRTVFISYASDTKPLAEELAKALESQGIEPWVDFRDLHPGQRWRDELDRAIDAAQWLIILVGEESRATPWQEAEWSAALAHTWLNSDKKLLPVIFGDSDPPPFLRNWVSLRFDPRTEASTWTSHVLDTLQNTRDEVVHEIGLQNRAERQRRLEEVQKAAEELRQSHPNEPPTTPPKARPQ
jgi:hypothetical protein